MSCVPNLLWPGLASFFLATGCALGSWSRVPVPPPTPVPDTLISLRNEVQIWLRDSVSPVTWLGVVISRDSVSGVLPEKNFLGGCSNCRSSPPGGRRMRVPLTEVDSVRVLIDRPENDFVPSAVGAALFVAVLVWCAQQQCMR
jgi:hypothetical protein